MATHSLPRLPIKERMLLEAIRRRGRVFTRIKELSEGDVEIVQMPFPATWSDGQDASPLSLSDDDILTCLHSLESRGFLGSSVTVFSASATEYICEWKLRDDR